MTTPIFAGCWRINALSVKQRRLGRDFDRSVKDIFDLDSMQGHNSVYIVGGWWHEPPDLDESVNVTAAAQPPPDFDRGFRTLSLSSSRPSSSIAIDVFHNVWHGITYSVSRCTIGVTQRSVSPLYSKVHTS
jgi:hypothetical protein